MVSVQESDRDVLRFLLFDNVDSENCNMINFVSDLPEWYLGSYIAPSC